MKKNGKLRDNTCWRLLCCICYSVIEAEKDERSTSPTPQIPKLPSTKEKLEPSLTQAPSHPPPYLSQLPWQPSPPSSLWPPSPPSPPWKSWSFAGADEGGGPPLVHGGPPDITN